MRRTLVLGPGRVTVAFVRWPRTVLNSAVLRFVAAGLVASAVITAGAYWVVSRNAVAEATRNAQEIGAIDGRSIVAPALTDAVIAGQQPELHRFDLMVRERVLSARVVRVKIWSSDGHIVYSDVGTLIGRDFPLDNEERAAIRENRVAAEVSELSKPENQYERGYGRLVEVYLPIRAVSGAIFLFETYQDFQSIAGDEARIWSAFFPVLGGGILLLLVVQVPLAMRMAATLESGRREREELLNRALDASAAERRRIARDLHDGVVQNLAGVAFSLGAASKRTTVAGDPELVAAMDEAAAATRGAVRDLRSLIVEIAPPDLDASRLELALGGLLEPLQGDGVDTSLSVRGVEDIDREQAVLIYRAVSEALRNVAAHAEARNVRVQVESIEARTVLRVEDDGRGFTADQVMNRQREGHVGLVMLRSLVEDGGGQLSVSSRPGEGSTITVSLAR